MLSEVNRMRRALAALSVAACAAFTLGASAQLSEYSQNFESLDQMAGDSLTNDGWIVFGNAFDGGVFQYGYGPFGAPNGGPGFSGITTGEGGPEQGANQLTIYNDYNNTDHNNGFLIESNVFQEQVVSAADVGKTYTFQFDAKRGNIVAPSTAVAFIKTLDPTAGFSLTNNITQDTSDLLTTWDTFSVSITIDGSLVGQLLQFGFLTTASNFEASGNFYDNISFTLTEDLTLANYAENFEALDSSDPEALGNTGWKVFGNVFDASGINYLYGYGPFPAPNDGGGFSGVATGQGGIDQGDNQLSIFSDYNNGDHGNGFLIESNVFQERVIGADNIGKTYTLQFDAKRGNIDGSSIASAFIKTLDPGAGFFVTTFETLDTSDIDITWNTYSLELTITEELFGQIIQIGFATVATNFEASGNFYDNITFNDGGVDTDGDGVDDSLDNCTLRANPDQRDSNGDGYGNACDPDFDDNGTVNFLDISGWAIFFNTACGDVDQDINGDGSCNFGDFSVITQFFNQPPGPSALAP